MPGVDLTQVSSNWKKLQEALEIEKKRRALTPAPAIDGLKRKRIDYKANAAFKKARLSGTNEVPEGIRRRMGTVESKPSAPTTQTSTRDRSNLVKEHGILPGDVAAAYGPANGAQRIYDDEVNQGLHPTRKIGKYVSLDCEMVGTGPPPHLDNVLARASLVNFHGEQIYDSYVRPPPKVKIEDYRTHVSGIKPAHLKAGVARPFSEVQKDVARLLQDRILVGHALRNDLQALILLHPKRDLRDTSRHPKFRIDSKGKPPALRKLAKAELGMSIQTGEHSSVEDARAAMLLFAKEKAGFEAENRKAFGQRRTMKEVEVDGAASTKIKGGDGEDSNEDENEDEDTLDGEEDSDDVDRVANEPAVALAKKKKTKKKKRTKRH